VAAQFMGNLGESLVPVLIAIFFSKKLISQQSKKAITIMAKSTKLKGVMSSRIANWVSTEKEGSSSSGSSN
jgi:putative effector of murein hydrolase LrgA (UPF0299 family)